MLKNFFFILIIFRSFDIVFHTSVLTVSEYDVWLLDNEFYFKQDVLEFWLQKGVDGFRADALKFMFESPNVTEDETGLTVTQDSPSPKL